MVYNKLQVENIFKIFFRWQRGKYINRTSSLYGWTSSLPQIASLFGVTCFTDQFRTIGFYPILALFTPTPHCFNTELLYNI